MTGSEAGGENLGRLKSKLRRHPAAMAALARMGLDAASIERLHLGLKEPYRARRDDLETRDALCFPQLAEGLRPIGRYAYVALPDVTTNPQSPGGWGPGPPLVYRIGSFAPDAVALVSADVVDCWLAWQLSRGALPAAFLSRSHAGGWPAEWRSPLFWAGFSRIVVMPGIGAADFMREVAHQIGRPAERLLLPAPFECLMQVAASSEAPSLSDMLREAEPLVVEPPRSAAAISPDDLGRFAATPVRIAGAFSGGHSYYPFLVENRGLEEVAGAQSRLVHTYTTMILRSDGHFLTTERLPAPRGTPVDRRILSLSDGTRILEEPSCSGSGTWSYGSIERFVQWRTTGGKPPFRPFPAMIGDVEAFLAARVWLPDPRHYLLAAMYVALSHVFQVFDALPLLLVCGGRGTGKSELGEAMARLGFNATVAGQLRAAGMIRLLDETRGLLVLDDMDGTGAASVTGTSELAQALKTSYKRSTSRKPLADRGGRIRMVDFYGPKVIGNTRGVDPVLGSRMLTIATGLAPDGFEPVQDDWTDERLSDLQDELHCWGMGSSAAVHEAYRALPTAFDRRSEIRSPMIAMSSASGDVALKRRVEECLAVETTGDVARIVS